MNEEQKPDATEAVAKVLSWQCGAINKSWIHIEPYADIRKSPPSEQSETAELDAAVIEAAEYVTNTQVSDLFRIGPDGQVFVETPLARLFQAVVHRSKALAPSLDDSIRAEVVDWANNPGSSSDMAAELAERILALVKARES